MISSDRIRHSRGFKALQTPARWLVVALVALILGPWVFGGTVSVQWDPVKDADLAGYRVYYGTSPGSRDNKLDAGKNTSAQISSLADCTIHYLAVRAYDTAGLESQLDSNMVKGFPRPTISGVSPASIKQGQTLTFTISGMNFDAGVAGDLSRPSARVKLSHSGLIVKSTTVSACGTISVQIEAKSDAAVGTSAVTTENPDLSYADPANRAWVFATLENAIKVEAADLTAPTIKSVTPPAGTKDVAATVQPTVTFSEAMLASSITSSTVFLVDAAGAVVPQASGWPKLNGAVVTISPASALKAGKTYQIKVLGGSVGVKDLAGNPLASDYIEYPGFTIAGSSDDSAAPAKWVSTNPAAGQTTVSLGSKEARIVFNRDLSSLWKNLTVSELQSLFRVTRNGRSQIQAATSPSWDSVNKTVVITLKDPFAAGGSFRTESGPASQKAIDTLTSAGVDPGELRQLKKTDPEWSTKSGADRAYRRVGKGPMSLMSITETTSTVPQENRNVPCASEFVVAFNADVAPERLLSTIYRILTADGREVRQKNRPRLEGNTTVVLTPAETLEAGRRYTISIRTGKSGALLKSSTGQFIEIVEPRLISVPMATEVGAASQTNSLGVAQ